MIEVNFFEKKQVNILPYIIGGIFFFVLVLMGTYFYVMQSHYSQVQADSNQWIQENAQDVALARRVESVSKLAEQSGDVQEMLNDYQYPMAFLSDDLASLIPEEEARVSSFQLNETNQFVMLMDTTNVVEASDILSAFETRDYLDSVQLLRVENQQNDTDQFIFELTADLNEEVLREVTER